MDKEQTLAERAQESLREQEERLSVERQLHVSQQIHPRATPGGRCEDLDGDATRFIKSLGSPRGPCGGREPQEQQPAKRLEKPEKSKARSGS